MCLKNRPGSRKDTSVGAAQGLPSLKASLTSLMVRLKSGEKTSWLVGNIPSICRVYVYIYISQVVVWDF